MNENPYQDYHVDRGCNIQPSPWLWEEFAYYQPDYEKKDYADHQEGNGLHFQNFKTKVVIGRLIIMASGNAKIVITQKFSTLSLTISENIELRAKRISRVENSIVATQV
jgi:hypothetical protein